MSLLRQIEQSVTELSSKEFQEFERWFEALQARRWDEQLERDARSGALDDAADAALAEFRSGKTRSL
ncbi:hypothetical protein [Rhizobium sp. CC-YZS058]|uniref:hypothetical protein n=1 Tax=Rhizobium sp. CC-YZS058 TaxID=3042153 RepID=UPI002B05ED68|nr:hypothetical protein [Rhizobium sp. CC-YZS058]MEA3534121.1 hypothetical protein [Rhizobium sp. CC-YZS058]